ncbi:SagB/ThcOx family dehydrogenase [Lentzea sp. E54]|uniref:SagB/ThcOx family dehydrogenase n=1 Tax=Lentzea xerophila TaxID=3435883 RepID=UPI003DA62A8A
MTSPAERIARRVIHDVPVRAARLVPATMLAVVTARELGMDRVTAARWFRTQARDLAVSLPPAKVHAKINAVYQAQRPALLHAIGNATEPEWTDAITRASDRSPEVWASHLRTLFDRMEVVPDEQRAVFLLTARALLDGDDDNEDVRYLERSKLHSGQDWFPSEVPAPVRTGDLPLPHEPMPAVSFQQVVSGRVTTRGAVKGPLNATELGTLLWNAHAETHRTEDKVHRPYPSAGTLYSARLRLFALSVDGVPPGRYDVVPDDRSLHRLGDLPGLDGLKGLSPYFSWPPDAPNAIALDDVPVLLGLYVDLGLLRRRYGLRALRLGLLEAGHLAQSLLMTASALGLAGAPVGGLNDDLAHELFALDDLAEPLQYVIPLGRATVDNPDERALRWDSPVPDTPHRRRWPDGA